MYVHISVLVTSMNVSKQYVRFVISMKKLVLVSVRIWVQCT